jgi:1-acyl-sn-glycerol-3-phosphate acyltransferase
MSTIEALPALRLTVGAIRVVRTCRRCWRLARAALHLLAGIVAAQILLLGPNALPRAQVQRMQRAVVRWWVRGLCRILHLELRVRGPLPSRTSLLVTNHVSWLDIPALLSVVDAAFVAKQDVVRWPVIGAMAARSGTIFLARGQRNAAKATADGMTWRLAQRRHVILFPEATTSDGRGVRRFYARLYQAAVRTHSRIQAVAIRYPQLDGPQGPAPFIDDDELLGHLWRLLGERRIVAELHFCDPIVPDADRRTLANRTRHQICAALGFETELSRPLSAKLRFPRQKPARRFAFG